MQTLGLSSKPQPTDSIFKRLFWPEIANQYDVDLVGQQGFWVCAVVGLLSMVISIASGQLWVGLLIGVTFLLGGMGVRERSIAAAVLVFLCYFLDRVASVEGMFFGFNGGNPMMGIAATLLLFSNVRATILSKRWKAPDTPEEIAEMPERFDSTFFDKVSNMMPAALWPKVRYVFYPLGGLVVLLSIVGLVMLPRMQHRRPVQQEPTAVYEVRP